MASTACFVIVSKNDIPIYEAEVGSAPKREDQAYQHQFILHAALDVVQDLAWATNTIFMLLHDSRSEDGIKSFFQEVHELYIKLGTRYLSNVGVERRLNSVAYQYFDN
uniref:Trafficking protein particle complex subunit n=1 Tax=Oryza meridionalis TaxID=40149 RepID=A0A0E0CNE7_9ORYZ